MQPCHPAIPTPPATARQEIRFLLDGYLPLGPYRDDEAQFTGAFPSRGRRRGCRKSQPRTPAPGATAPNSSVHAFGEWPGQPPQTSKRRFFHVALHIGLKFGGRFENVMNFVWAGNSKGTEFRSGSHGHAAYLLPLATRCLMATRPGLRRSKPWPAGPTAPPRARRVTVTLASRVHQVDRFGRNVSQLACNAAVSGAVYSIEAWLDDTFRVLSHPLAAISPMPLH